ESGTTLRVRRAYRNRAVEARRGGRTNGRRSSGRGREDRRSRSLPDRPAHHRGPVGSSGRHRPTLHSGSRERRLGTRGRLGGLQRGGRRRRHRASTYHLWPVPGVPKRAGHALREPLVPRHRHRRRYGGASQDQRAGGDQAARRRRAPGRSRSRRRRAHCLPRGEEGRAFVAPRHQNGGHRGRWIGTYRHPVLKGVERHRDHRPRPLRGGARRGQEARGRPDGGGRRLARGQNNGDDRRQRRRGRPRLRGRDGRREGRMEHHGPRRVALHHRLRRYGRGADHRHHLHRTQHHRQPRRHLQRPRRTHDTAGPGQGKPADPHLLARRGKRSGERSQQRSNPGRPGHPDPGRRRGI
ncbi:MAG: Alcohol dehydrogenase (Zn-containing), partial [uncultured Rubrobacteraceae bacterium]